jgi:riboflavin biosynthesis pyrimidine reductase
MPRKFRSQLRGVAKLHLSESEDVDLAEMLRRLRRDYEVRRVACEGGPILFRSLLKLGLVDELNLTIAPYLFGGADAPTLTGLSKKFLPASVLCVTTSMRVVGDECFLTYRIKKNR